MKKSTKILLTLFLPTLTAGCSDTSHQTTAVRRDCSTPAQPGEPPKEPCPPETSGSGTSHGTSTTNRVSHSYSYFPFFMPWMSSSGTRNSSLQSSSSTSSASHSSTAPHTSTGISSGGFGRTGSFMSGSS